jgi:hypothetical protein
MPARQNKVVQSKAASKSKASKPQTSPQPLSGGNPQIAKADGDAPVQAYIAAMPGWKRDMGQQLDALIMRELPHVKKAVHWNTPFYGIEGQGWFLAFHCFAKYIKVAFLRGRALQPMPPIESKDPNARYLHIFEGDALDEKQIRAWLKQAAKMQGDPLF